MSDSGAVLWRCRRGMKELDVLLERYARGAAYEGAGERERALFAQLLALPDPLLADFLFGYAVPERKELVAVINRIQGATAERARADDDNC